MAKIAIVVLAGTEARADLGRLVNALETAKECMEAGDDLELIFDGAAVQWVGELEDDDHPYSALYRTVSDEVAVCDYCVGAYGAAESVDAAGVTRVDEFEGHPSIRSLAADGYEVITF